MPQLKAIIFDLDGTIADTEELHRQAFNQAFEEFGIDCHWSIADYIKLLAISGGRDRLYKFLSSRSFSAPGKKNLRDYTLALHQRKSEIYRQAIATGRADLRTGVKRLIKEARQAGVMTAIATNSSQENAELLLHKLLGKEALSYFSSLASCNLIIDKKPAPAIYQYTLANLCLAAEDCVAIEDSRNGNLSALAAGIKPVITHHPLTAGEEFTGAALVIDHLGEPGNGFTVFAGNANGAEYINIEALGRLLSHSG